MKKLIVSALILAGLVAVLVVSTPLRHLPPLVSIRVLSLETNNPSVATAVLSNGSPYRVTIVWGIEGHGPSGWFGQIESYGGADSMYAALGSGLTVTNSFTNLHHYRPWRIKAFAHKDYSGGINKYAVALWDNYIVRRDYFVQVVSETFSQQGNASTD